MWLVLRCQTTSLTCSVAHSPRKWAHTEHEHRVFRQRASPRKWTRQIFTYASRKPGIEAQNTAREITFSEQLNMPPKMGLLMTKYCTPKVALSSDAKFTRKVNLQLKLVSNLCCLFLRVIACYNITSDHIETLEFFKYLFFSSSSVTSLYYNR